MCRISATYRSPVILYLTIEDKSVTWTGIYINSLLNSCCGFHDYIVHIVKRYVINAILPNTIVKSIWVDISNYIYRFCQFFRQCA